MIDIASPKRGAQKLRPRPMVALSSSRKGHALVMLPSRPHIETITCDSRKHPVTESLFLLPLGLPEGDHNAIRPKSWLVLRHELSHRLRSGARVQVVIAIMTGDLNETQLEALIPRFYARVREDMLIGPVFEGAISDWEEHLHKLVTFWSSVMLTSGRYKGNPVAAHAKHAELIKPAMFDRWLALWSEVTEEVLPAAVATSLQLKAARIAESLKLALYFRLPSSAGATATAAAVTHISKD